MALDPLASAERGRRRPPAERWPGCCVRPVGARFIAPSVVARQVPRRARLKGTTAGVETRGAGLPFDAAKPRGGPWAGNNPGVGCAAAGPPCALSLAAALVSPLVAALALTVRAHRPTMVAAVLDGELAVPCTRNPLYAGSNSSPRAGPGTAGPGGIPIAGSCAAEACEPRQVRKEAAVSGALRVPQTSLA